MTDQEEFGGAIEAEDLTATILAMGGTDEVARLCRNHLLRPARLVVIHEANR